MSEQKGSSGEARPPFGIPWRVHAYAWTFGALSALGSWLGSRW